MAEHVRLYCSSWSSVWVDVDKEAAADESAVLPDVVSDVVALSVAGTWAKIYGKHELGIEWKYLRLSVKDLPFFSGWTRFNTGGGKSPFGSRTGSTREPLIILLARTDVVGTVDTTDSVELLASFCSFEFDVVNGEYKLVDIEFFAWKDSFDESEFVICDDSLFDIIIDFDMEFIGAGRGKTSGNCERFFKGVDDDSSVTGFGVFNADLRNFATVLETTTKKISKGIIELNNKISMQKSILQSRQFFTRKTISCISFILQTFSICFVF